jgi:hypothetical protein
MTKNNGGSMRPLILIGGLFLMSASSYADIMNGTFELGDFTNWTVGGSAAHAGVLANGDFHSSPGGGVSIAPPEGTYYALLSNGPGDRGGSPFDTTSLTTIPYLVGLGASISFTIDFFTNEFPSGNPDFYTVSVLGLAPTTLAAGDTTTPTQNQIPGVDCVNTFVVAPDGTTVCAHSGVQTFNDVPLAAYVGQTVQFQFFVSDAVDNTFDSALLVDNVHCTGCTVPVSATPEPGTWLLLGSAMIPVLIGAKRRFSSRQAC